jgi:hypothetical protein
MALKGKLAVRRWGIFSRFSKEKFKKVLKRKENFKKLDFPKSLKS